MLVAVAIQTTFYHHSKRSTQIQPKNGPKMGLQAEYPIYHCYRLREKRRSGILQKAGAALETNETGNQGGKSSFRPRGHFLASLAPSNRHFHKNALSLIF